MKMSRPILAAAVIVAAAAPHTARALTPVPYGPESEGRPAEPTTEGRTPEPISPGRAISRGRTAKNSIYVEGLGPGLVYSINYERLIENDFAVRLGFSYLSASASATSGGTTASASVSWISVPLTVSYLGIGSGNHALELGAGGVLISASGTGSSGVVSASGSGMGVLGTAMIGYRRQPTSGGFQFRIGFSPLFGKGLGLDSSNRDPAKLGIVPWFYLSLGATF